jgi:DNA uptake protein ComE-like DNA-binding protein
MNLKKPVAFVLSLVLAAGMTSAVYGQAKKGAAKSAKTAAPKAAAAAPTGENADALDLNSAPLEKLMTLTGVDLMTAKKIVAARPYKNKTEVVSKKIMSQEDFNHIARGVTVKAPEKDAAPAKGKKG